MIDLRTYLECRNELNEYMNEILKPHDEYIRKINGYLDKTWKAIESQRRFNDRVTKMLWIQSASIVILGIAVIIQAVI